MYAIETERLSKKFHGIYAVKDLNMHVPEGSIYGFIGENGSGKSTTQKLICGLLRPKRKSRITLFGKPYTDPAIRADIGVLIENPACFPNSTVKQNLIMQGLNLGLDHPEAEAERVLALVHMESAAKRRFRDCSLGMKQRIGVAQALLGRPRLLILDEPINGLDADGMRIVRETLQELNREEGVTVLISSHILGELGKLATHYGIIKDGSLIREMPAEDMSRECRDYVFVHTDNDLKAFAALRDAYGDLNVTDGGICVYDESDPLRLSRLLTGSDLAIGELTYRRVGLEDYYMDVMRKESA